MVLIFAGKLASPIVIARMGYQGEPIDAAKLFCVLRREIVVRGRLNVCCSEASVALQRSCVTTKLSQLRAVMVALARPKEPSVTMNLGALSRDCEKVYEGRVPLFSCIENDRTRLLASLKAIPIGFYTHLNFAFAFIVLLPLKTHLIECHH